jgi:hypothetical protein
MSRLASVSALKYLPCNPCTLFSSFTVVICSLVSVCASALVIFAPACAEWRTMQIVIISRRLQKLILFYHLLRSAPILFRNPYSLVVTSNRSHRLYGSISPCRSISAMKTPYHRFDSLLGSTVHLQCSWKNMRRGFTRFTRTEIARREGCVN